MGKRPDGFYPTDMYAVEALYQWLLAMHPQSLRETWIDPAAGYGGLVQGLRILVANRRAIELHARHRPELLQRVPSAHIGDGLALPWDAKHCALNPDFNNKVMTAFVTRALEHQQRTGGLVCCLALATWWHSDAVRVRGLGLRKPSHILVPDRRVSCDGSGRGDMRAIDWLVWVLGETETRVEWLPPAAPDARLVAEHRRLVGVVS